MILIMSDSESSQELYYIQQKICFNENHLWSCNTEWGISGSNISIIYIHHFGKYSFFFWLENDLILGQSHLGLF